MLACSPLGGQARGKPRYPTYLVPLDAWLCCTLAIDRKQQVSCNLGSAFSFTQRTQVGHILYYCIYV
jgi:hypothetical protein